MSNSSIVRPGFFMETFEGMTGSFAVGVMKNGMKKDAKLQLVVRHQISPLVSGNLTTSIHTLRRPWMTLVRLRRVFSGYGHVSPTSSHRADNSAES
jgi:hypothetical protein